jgi:glutathione S-transferase
MKLYYMPGACSLASHILLREANIPVELERVGRDKKTEHGEDFMAVNPKGYVPTLIMEDGDTLTENVVVHGYIADLKPELKLAPPHGTKARVKQDELAVYVSTELHKTLGALFNPAITEEGRKASIEKAYTRFSLIEKMLSDGRAFIMGDHFASVDAYLYTVTIWTDPLKVDMSAFPNLAAYRKRVSARPAVQAALVAEGLVPAA